MKKSATIVALCISFFAGAAFSYVRDWHDLDAVHKHLNEAIHEMERARAANHYDMKGHGKKAEELMRDAERELHEAVEAAKTE
jgi:uncharacterized membrane protein (DUF106 family)